jgi:hypothetical protein
MRDLGSPISLMVPAESSGTIKQNQAGSQVFPSCTRRGPSHPSSPGELPRQQSGSSPTASKPAVSEVAESVSIPALRDIDQAPSLEHSPVPGSDGGPTGPEGGKSGAQPFLLITS